MDKSFTENWKKCSTENSKKKLKQKIGTHDNLDSSNYFSEEVIESHLSEEGEEHETDQDSTSKLHVVLWLVLSCGKLGNNKS